MAIAPPVALYQLALNASPQVGADALFFPDLRRQ